MQQVVDLWPAGGWDEAHRSVQAELATAAVLEQLGPQWRVLHSVPVGPGPAVVHHLVVGPAGILAVRSLPPGAPVVEVVDGRPELSAPGLEDAVAEVRQLAQRVLAGLRHRLGSAVDVPAVHPLVCVTGGGPPPASPSGEVVPVERLLADLEARPRRLTDAWAQRLTAVASEPLTWDAPGVEGILPDVAARYDALTAPTGTLPRPRTDAEERVVQGQVTASQPPELAAHAPGLRTASVLLVLLGMASMGTGGVLSPPTLAFGGWTVRHYGGFRWLNDRDASLVMVGMVMAVLPLPFLVVVLSSMAASAA
jgi:hypothetical protein